MAEAVNLRLRPRKNLMSMIEEFKLGCKNLNDLAYQGRIVRIKNYDILEKPSGHGLNSDKDWKIKTVGKEDPEHSRAAVYCHGGQKTTLLMKEPLQEISSAMFIGRDFMMIGGGSPQTLKLLNMDTIRRTKNQVAKDDGKAGRRADQVKKNPDVEERMEDVTDILPDCYENQQLWRAELKGVRGLTRLRSPTMMMEVVLKNLELT